MPPSFVTGQPDSPGAWFGSSAGRVLLESESLTVAQALSERPGQPWLWLMPVPQGHMPDGHGLRLLPWAGEWAGDVRCSESLPLASESVAGIVLQHVATADQRGMRLLTECARVMVPGARLWLFVLNPLTPYRWRWRGTGLRAAEPIRWRRRLRSVGLSPDVVSQGIGPTWQIDVSDRVQDGAGLRAACAIRAEKRALPLTPTRQRAPLRLAEGIPAA